MKLTKNKIKYLIREAVTSQIKHITPRDRAIRRLPHEYQYPENPEDTITNQETKDKISVLRRAGGESAAQADELAPALGGSQKPHFAPRKDMSFEDLHNESEIMKALSYVEYAHEESAYLEIEYRLIWVVEYELIQIAKKLKIKGLLPDSIMKRKDLITNSRLVQIMDNLYDGKNLAKFYTDIYDYISNPVYQKEREKITKAFNDTPSDSRAEPTAHWKPKSWFSWTSQGEFDNLEDFLAEKADRLCKNALDDKGIEINY